MRISRPAARENRFRFVIGDALFVRRTELCLIKNDNCRRQNGTKSRRLPAFLDYSSFRSAVQPSTTSRQVASKLPVYHGSATSRSSSMRILLWGRRCCGTGQSSFRSAVQPSTTSRQVASKLPVYHGSATSRSSSMRILLSGSPPQMRSMLRMFARSMPMSRSYSS